MAQTSGNHSARLLATLGETEEPSHLRPLPANLRHPLILNHAVTRGLIAETPLKRLSKTERPRVRNKSEPRVLTRDETAKLIAKTPKSYRALIAATAVTGARQSEVLGLTWGCIDFEAGVIRFKHQLSRAKTDSPARLVPLKSGGDRRDIELIPAVGYGF